MTEVALIGLVDDRGWLLLQERDELAPSDPNLWSLVGGGIETGESPASAAHRELAEETGLTGVQLRELERRELPCPTHGSDVVHLYAARTSARDSDVICGEGRQIVFVAPDELSSLELSALTQATYAEVLAACSAG